MPNTTKPVRVLDADVYDALELSAMIYGGIGQPDLFSDIPEGPFTAPVCILGHCEWADPTPNWRGYVVNAVQDLFTDGAGFNSDNAVIAINRRRGRPEETRVPFAEWCHETGVVRGPHPVAA